MSVVCSQRQGVNNKVDWQSEQWLSCHGKIKRWFQQSAQESAFEQGPCNENCSNRLHSDQHSVKNEDEIKKVKFPQADKKKVVHAIKHAGISSEQPGYFHIYKNKNDKVIGSAAKSCVVLASQLISNWGRAHTAKQGMPICVCESAHDALLQTCCPNISSRLTFLPVLGIPPRLSCACVRDR